MRLHDENLIRDTIKCVSVLRRLVTFEGSCPCTKEIVIFKTGLFWMSKNIKPPTDKKDKEATMWYGWHICSRQLISVEAFATNKIKDINTDNLRKWKINFIHILYLVGRRKKHSCFIDSSPVGRLLRETPHSHTARKKTESKREEIIEMARAGVIQEGEKEG